MPNSRLKTIPKLLRAREIWLQDSPCYSSRNEQNHANERYKSAQQAENDHERCEEIRAIADASYAECEAQNADEQCGACEESET